MHAAHDRALVSHHNFEVARIETRYLRRDPHFIFGHFVVGFELGQDFLLRLKPVLLMEAVPAAARLVDFIGSLGDQFARFVHPVEHVRLDTRHSTWPWWLRLY